MKMARMPTTIARTPRPSAKPARMIARPRIWPAASGLRPMAEDDRPARMPMPMPGPMTPMAARPAPMCSMNEFPPWVTDRGCGIALRGGLERRHVVRRFRLGVTQRLLGDVALLAAMALDREDDEHQGEDAEDERLDGVEHQLEGDHQDGHDRERQGGDDPERDLAAVDVAEEPHRQRDRLDELEHELDQADE